MVPVGPEIQSTGENTTGPVRLYVFAGADGEFVLYEDENVNYNYEKGAYSEIPIAYNEAEKSLTIGDRKGSFDGMPEERVFEIVWVSKDNPTGVDFDRAADNTVNYAGKSVRIARE